MTSWYLDKMLFNYDINTGKTIAPLLTAAFIKAETCYIALLLYCTACGVHHHEFT